MAGKYSTTEVVIPPVTAHATVEHLAAPPTFERPKRIHPRRVLPPVTLGKKRDFHSMTPELALFRSSPIPVNGDLAFDTVTALTGPATNNTASNVGEPSVAMHDKIVFYTGNWYAAVSTDAGKTFSYIDPANAFKQFDPPGKSFCCDQVVQYISAIDTFVWLLQYGPDTGDNIQRLAFAKSGDVAARRWQLFDITTDMIGAKGAFMDFPDLALGADCLYVTTNVFPDSSVGSVVLRIPFSGITSGSIVAKTFLNFDFNSFRVAQNCGSTAYFAAHKDSSTLAVFSWPEADDAPTQTLVGVSTWVGGTNGYSSDLPDHRTWLDRADPRITGATLAGHEIYFAWTVDKGSNGRANAFVQIARIDATDLTLLENINIFDPVSATAYPALNTNANGEVGITYVLGGGPKFPTHMVGILTNPRKNLEVATSARGPLDPNSGKGEWGDYLTARRAYPREKLFAATGYTMDGAGNGMNRDVTPRFVIFGRAADVGAAGTTTPAAPAAPTRPAPAAPAAPAAPPAGVTPTGAFTDVNVLPVVDAAIARKVLNACMAAGAAAPMAAPETPLRFVNPELVTKPGVERWSIKTGQDAEIAKVGDLGVAPGKGIVPITVEELIRIPRPADFLPVTSEIAKYETKRAGPTEFIVWQITGMMIFMKLEADGDYHVVVQGASGDTVIVEIPTPTKPFLGNSPWLTNIKAARAAMDQKFGKMLQPQNFTMLDGTLVPRESLSIVQASPQALPQALPESLTTPEEGKESTVPTFKTALPSTRARVTGVGFFDKVHGQNGVATLNGIELHSVLKVEFV
jgi:hypothetical protein